jgi:hypothetical protein
MYVLHLDSTQRDYLLSLLKKQLTFTATALVEQLTSSDNAFGVAMWSEDDIAWQLREQGVPDTAENIRAVRESYYGRHIDDQMVEHGWGVLGEAEVAWVILSRQDWVLPSAGLGQASSDARHFAHHACYRSMSPDTTSTLISGGVLVHPNVPAGIHISG